MADTTRKRRATKAQDTAPAAATTGVLYVRGVSAETIAALDAWVTSRRAELAAAAVDNATRRLASSFSRNDLLVDIVDAAVRARTDASKSSP